MAFLVLRASKHLNIAVDVGLVVGITAATAASKTILAAAIVQPFALG